MWSEFFFMITDTVDLHIHVYTVIYIFMFTQMKNIKLVLNTVKYTKIILLYSFENPQDRQFPPIRNYNKTSIHKIIQKIKTPIILCSEALTLILLSSCRVYF